jgi:hypothetical protein
VHQTTDGIVRHEQAEELLLDQFWRLAAQHDLSPAKMGFQLVQGGFDFPPLRIKSCHFLSRCLLVIEDGGDQPV